ncbi:formate/nitrite transporter family protein, partial [Anaerovibrio sp.]|uniref:formate/nitrite transporter family protein n=1 Tax=Anaerovibrio sp. TaxID=1872532 RepID=UPI003F16B0E2
MVKENGRLFVSSVLAGMCIALGGTVFLRLKDAFTGGNVAGAVLFTVGLFVVCTRGYALFTGKACYIFDNGPDYLARLAVIWLGNLAGTGFFALAERMTSICGD